MENEHPEQPESSNDIYLTEQGDSNITIDSSDICYDRAQDDKDETDDLDQERDLLASLIQKLKCEIDDSKNQNKFLESSNKELVDKLKGEIETLYPSPFRRLPSPHRTSTTFAANHSRPPSSSSHRHYPTMAVISNSRHHRHTRLQHHRCHHHRNPPLSSSSSHHLHLATNLPPPDPPPSSPPVLLVITTRPTNITTSLPPRGCHSRRTTTTFTSIFLSLVGCIFI
ncbi:hypothetical protein Tco_1238623 [Tanacetum coccineum]